MDGKTARSRHRPSRRAGRPRSEREGDPLKRGTVYARTVPKGVFLGCENETPRVFLISTNRRECEFFWGDIQVKMRTPRNEQVDCLGHVHTVY